MDAFVGTAPAPSDRKQPVSVFAMKCWAVVVLFVSITLTATGAAGASTEPIADLATTTTLSVQDPPDPVLGAITGVVVFDADGVLDESSEPIANVMISLFECLCGPGETGPFGWTARTTTADDGTFAFDDLRPNLYQVLIRPTPDAVAPGTQPMGADVDVTLRPGDSVTIAYDPADKLGSASPPSTTIPDPTTVELPETGPMPLGLTALWAALLTCFGAVLLATARRNSRVSS